MIRRRKTRQVRIGGVRIGGGAPVSIQSMTKTETADAWETINQIKRLQKAGCEIVRAAVKNNADLAALYKIKKAVKIPLVADIHFNYQLALGVMKAGVDAVRLNPGNIYREKEVREVIKEAKKRRIPIRVGINSGSLRAGQKNLSQDKAMVRGALDYIKYFEKANFRDIIISLKSSSVLSTIAAYKQMAKLCDYPFHVGLTATGLEEDGIIKSAMGIGALLSEGIGDTIRVSLTSDPVREVEAAKSILQSLGLRRFGPELISCPTCGRCSVDLEKIARELKHKLYAVRCTPYAKRPTTIAVMGCEVNGPGEAKGADIGVAAGKSSGVLFKKGKIVKRVKEKDFTKEILSSL